MYKKKESVTPSFDINQLGVHKEKKVKVKALWKQDGKGKKRKKRKRKYPSQNSPNMSNELDI